MGIYLHWVIFTCVGFWGVGYGICGVLGYGSAVDRVQGHASLPRMQSFFGALHGHRA